MSGLGWVVCAVLLIADAGRDGDEVAEELARRWIWGWGREGASGGRGGGPGGGGAGWKEVVEWGGRRWWSGIGGLCLEGRGEGRGERGERRGARL